MLLKLGVVDQLYVSEGGEGQRSKSLRVDQLCTWWACGKRRTVGNGRTLVVCNLLVMLMCACLCSVTIKDENGVATELRLE